MLFLVRVRALPTASWTFAAPTWLTSPPLALVSRVQERVANLQHTPAARTNKNSLPVDPLTLDYQNSKEGEKLRARDMAQKGRAQARADRLYGKLHSVDFDILTGLPRQHMPQSARE